MPELKLTKDNKLVEFQTSGLSIPEWYQQKQKPLSPSIFCELAAKLYEMLNIMHHSGVCHGNISLNSVIITAGGRIMLTQCDPRPASKETIRKEWLQMLTIGYALLTGSSPAKDLSQYKSLSSNEQLSDYPPNLLKAYDACFVDFDANIKNLSSIISNIISPVKETFRTRGDERFQGRNKRLKVYQNIAFGTFLFVTMAGGFYVFKSFDKPHENAQEGDLYANTNLHVPDQGVLDQMDEQHKIKRHSLPQGQTAPGGNLLNLDQNNPFAQAESSESEKPVVNCNIKCGSCGR